MSKERARQLAQAQENFRGRMRSNGFRRLQEWLPAETLDQLKIISVKQGVSQRVAVERLICAAYKAKNKKKAVNKL